MTGGAIFLRKIGALRFAVGGERIFAENSRGAACPPARREYFRKEEGGRS